jgi:inorganic pyrophosphatase
VTAGDLARFSTGPSPALPKLVPTIRGIARMKRLLVLSLALAAVALAPAPSGTADSRGPRSAASAVHLVDGHPARLPDGRVNAVIEIPAGTNAKWEVDKRSGQLVWELKDGRPRVVRFLPYPSNYGMIPRTLLPSELGGDGDPLDVIVLGPALARGSVVAVRLVGLLELLDGGEQDDKLIAVAEGSPLEDVASLAELDARYPGATRILETWFTSYKGPGELESRGFADAERAGAILDAAIAAYRAGRHEAG